MNEQIALVGAHLHNKGDQAMVFTAVDQLKRRYPNAEITLFSEIDFNRTDEEKGQYNFGILPWNGPLALRTIGVKEKLYDADFYDWKTVKEQFRESDVILDLNGYGLGSDWGFRGSMGYLLNIIAAKRWGIPYYVMPQSIGPFDYSLSEWCVLAPLLKRYLKYPEKIWVRERAKDKFLNQFKNVAWSPDLVLQTDGYSLTNIFRDTPTRKYRFIDEKSVGIIPSTRVWQRLNCRGAYRGIISELLKNDRTVYLLRHSYEDWDVCRDIKSFFKDDERVKLIPEDLNAIALEWLIQRFELVIASRYHAVIHAYKHGVPALVIGWADKYLELMKLFHSDEFLWDIRYTPPSPLLTEMLDKLITNPEEEGMFIRSAYNALRKSMNNVFDEVKI
jgi:polysaccharide pyruvyl transferase WcaK-like protein